MATIFQPVVRIVYAQRGFETMATVSTYDIHGKMHYKGGEPIQRPLEIAQIPTLLFQLVERGYVVKTDPDFQSNEIRSMGVDMRSILAFSSEWLERAASNARGLQK